MAERKVGEQVSLGGLLVKGNPTKKIGKYVTYQNLTSYFWSDT